MMKRAFFGMILLACGGTGTIDGDGGADSGGDVTVNDSGPGNDSGSGNDSGPGNDAGTDAGCGDGGCAQFTGDCTTSKCGTNEVCVDETSGVQELHRCYPLPACGCGGKSTCECIGTCACGGSKINCQDTDAGIACVGPISRREFKTDISYVTDEEQQELARETLQTNLAEYRYKTEPESSKRHLGFIIDDMPASSPAVQGDRTHVDLYGYTTMLLATVKEQQKQIDALKKQVDQLKR